MTITTSTTEPEARTQGRSGAGIVSITEAPSLADASTRAEFLRFIDIEGSTSR